MKQENISKLLKTYPHLIAHDTMTGYHKVFKRPTRKNERLISHLFIRYNEQYTSVYYFDEDGKTKDPIITHLSDEQASGMLENWDFFYRENL